MISYITSISIVFDELNLCVIFKHSHPQTVLYVGGYGCGNQHFCTNVLHDVELLCFYTCLSFCPQGGVPDTGGAWSREWGVENPPGTATAAGGTYPTGMHSCFINFFRHHWDQDVDRRGFYQFSLV